MEMKKYKLYEVADYVSSKVSTSQLSLQDYVTTDNLLQNKCGRECAENLPPQSAKVTAYKPGDILVSNIRPYLKKIWYANSEGGNSADVLTIRAKEDFEKLYIYYTLFQDSFFDYVSKGVKGSKMPRGDKNHIMNFEILVPENLQVQKKIASTLSTLDQRIENLRAQNRVLEQTAKTIYDYTFLQCAGHQTTYNKTLNRNIPADWEVKNIFDVFDIKYGFPFSTELFTEKITDKPVVRIRDILEHTTSAYTTEIVDEKYRLQEGDLVIGMDGNFHMNLWTDNISYLNQRCVRIRMNGNNVTSVQAKFALAPYIKAKEMTAKGSTVGHLSDKDLKGMFILVPDSKTLNNFNAQVLPILQKQLVNTKQIEALTTQRNTLLPLLMTGQVTIA